MTTTSKPSFFISVRLLLLISFSLLLTVILAGIFYWFYSFATQQATAQVTEDLIQTVQMAALNVDGDELLAISREAQANSAGLAWQAVRNNEAKAAEANQKYGSPNQAGFSDDPRYQRLMSALDPVHQIEPRAWPYLWVYTETEGEVIYVVDLAARYNPEKSTLFLEHDVDTDFTTELTLSTDDAGKLTSYKDNWGEWYSAWLPVTDSSGQIIGGVGVDFEAGEVDQVQDAIRSSLLIAFLLTFVVVLVAIFLIARTITRPIVVLTEAANAVGEGNYEQDFASLQEGKLFHNEVGVLARVFGLMVAKIHQRVEKLQQQVKDLRIEIDHAKRKDEVDEISNTDFFRDLKTKASALRKQRGDAADNDDEDEK